MVRWKFLYFIKEDFRIVKSGWRDQHSSFNFFDTKAFWTLTHLRTWHLPWCFSCHLVPNLWQWWPFPWQPASRTLTWYLPSFTTHVRLMQCLFQTDPTLMQWPWKSQASRIILTFPLTQWYFRQWDPHFSPATRVTPLCVQFWPAYSSISKRSTGNASLKMSVWQKRTNKVIIKNLQSMMSLQ